MKNPCIECPFKRDSAPGYLGAASGDPQIFIDSMEYNLLPCHMAVNWDEADEEEVIRIAEKHPCIGALQFCTNSHKLPRGAREEGAYKELLIGAVPNPDVFKWNHEFKEHHQY